MENGRKESGQSNSGPSNSRTVRGGKIQRSAVGREAIMDRVKYMRGESDTEHGVRLLSDVLDTLESEQAPKHGDNWGRWKLNGHGNNWTLDLEHYYIRLDRITSNAQMNDWIFQMAGKTWVTPEDLGNLVLAFDDIFSPQATLCGEGKDKTLKPDYVNGVLGEPLGDVAEAEDQETED